MTLIFEDESGITLDLAGEDAEETARKVISASLDVVSCPFEAEVNLLITNGPEIRSMNAQYRGIDRETDVLSFPMNEFSQAGSFADLEDDPNAAFDPDTGELVLGDIVINADRVIVQAEEFGHSQLREYAFLIAHSMLHLTGCDHIEETDRNAMEDRQREIMELLQISRS